MRLAAFHPLLRNAPDRVLKVDLVPNRIEQFALAHHRQQNEPEAEPNGRERRHVLDLGERDPNLGWGKCPVFRREGRDGSRTDLVRGIGDLLAMKDGEGIDLLDDVAHMDGRGRCASVLHLDALRPQIIGRDLREPPAFPDREDVAIEDRLAHGAGAIRHRRVLEPALANDSKRLACCDPALVALLLLSGRTPLLDFLSCLDTSLTCFGKRPAARSVAADGQGLAPAVETVVIPERDLA